MISNPLLGQIKYEVQYLDDFVEHMTQNQIADNMLLRVDYEGNHFLLLKDVTDYFKDSSDITNTNGLLTRQSGNLHAKKKTRG